MNRSQSPPRVRRPRELVLSGRQSMERMPENHDEWPERMVYRGRSWSFMTSCMVILLSPFVGLLLDFGLPLVGVTAGVEGFMVYVPLLASLCCVFAAACSPRFEMTVVPKAIPGVIGEPFEAAIELQLPNTPRSFEVAFYRNSNEPTLYRASKRRRSFGNWSSNLKIPMPAVRSLGNGRYRIEVAIDVPPMEKGPNFTWALFVQARTAGFSGDYRVFFPVAMNETERDA